MIKRQSSLLSPEFPELDGLPEAPAPRSKKAEDLFATHCIAYGLPPHLRQLKFAKEVGRQWKFDFAFPGFMLAVEIDGIVVKRIGGQLFCMGRHATISGIQGDNEKINTAVRLGWSVLRFVQGDVKPRRAVEETMRVLAARGWRKQP